MITTYSRAISLIRRSMTLALSAVAILGSVFFFSAAPAVAEEIVVYKSPSCGCCGNWVKHIRQSGFDVVVKDLDDMDTIKRQAGIPEELQSCHTASVGGYLVEGHVPASDIKRMLTERPAIKGLTIPGMPASAPGMDAPGKVPYTVLTFDAKGKTGVYSKY